MPPRLSLGPLRCIRAQIPRRSYASSKPPPFRSYRDPLLFGVGVLGLGTYYLSRDSHAEVQSTKTRSQNENRELTASASRKAAEKDGKAEKESHQTGGSSQDNKPEKAVAEKTPQKGADEDSATGKVKGGHDESGQPRDDRLRGKGGKILKDDNNDNKNAEKDQQNKDKGEEKEEEEDTEEEQQGQQAVNPETGEINWDCPCLGDMPHGVCGPQFRKAFSCFVQSEAEPKGQDCIDAFAEMQDCFRAHPDVYKPLDALDDDELDDISEEALETATKKGDEKLETHSSDKKDNKSSKEEKKDKEEKKRDDGATAEHKSQDKEESQTHEKNKKSSDKKKSSANDPGEKKPKQGNERKNESVVPRSG